MADKYAFNIKGVIYDDGEKVEVLWNGRKEWKEGTLIRSGIWWGWAIMDARYDSRPVKEMDAIRKIKSC